MRPRDGYELPPDKERANDRAVRLEWWTIGWMLSVVLVIYLAMGSSQAMKAAWIEDLLSLVPPIAFLIATRFRSREPNEKFPYGYHRAISIAFLCAAVALLAMGAFSVFDSASALLRQHHPSIGSIELLGRQVWLGWIMIAALTYSIIPPVILGRMKQPLAKELHDKALHADADMNKADWLTGLAGIVGILGVGLGWWWADPVAALFISVEIVRDGVKNLKRVVEDLIDRRPMTVDGELEPFPDQLLQRLKALDWVEDADLRFREEGHVFTGEVYVVPRSGTSDLVKKLESITEIAARTDWRIYDLVVMPVAKIDPRHE